MFKPVVASENQKKNPFEGGISMDTGFRLIQAIL